MRSCKSMTRPRRAALSPTNAAAPNRGTLRIARPLSRMFPPLAVLCCLHGGVSPCTAVELPFKDLPSVDLAFDFDGKPVEWKLDRKTDTEARYLAGGYALTVRLNEDEAYRLLRFTLEPTKGDRLSLRSYEAKVTLPLTGLHAVTAPSTRHIAHTLIHYHEHKKWPDMRIYRCLIPQGFKELGSAHCEAPFILLTGSKGENRIAVGWTVPDRGTTLTGDQDGQNYVLRLSREDDIPMTGSRIEDCLVISTRDDGWWDTTRAYANLFDRLNTRQWSPPPAWALEPVFCTWYCYLDHIDQKGVLKIARKCKDLGFGTILIDAGWDCRPDGGYGDFKKGILGDFQAMPDRFPDLPAAVKQMHDMGLRVELWSAPFWQGRESKAYREKTRDWHAQTAEGENHSLCPRYPETRTYFKERFAWVARTYGIDGMWLDAADSVPPHCTAGHKHLDQPMGQAFTDCLAAIRDGLRSVNPQAVTEARVLHANLHTKRALSVVQPSDAPESFEVLRTAGIHIRAWADGIVLKNDPMFWAKNADATTVGKFLATMVCNGVPALSVDYLTASEEHCELTAAWLSFYKQHMPTLLRGEFRLFGADYGIPDMMLVGETEAVVYMRNPETQDVQLPRRVAKVILLNCTDKDTLRLRITPAGAKQQIQSYRPDWREDGPPVAVEAISGATASYRVPQGGAAIAQFE